MKISEAEMADMRKIVSGSGIRIKTLEDDIIDHLCCVVEDSMKRGKPFKAALDEALIELAPGGLHEIELDTHYLLNSNKIINMKRITYILGLLFTMAFLTGWVFGFLHYPGAMELSVGGFTGFALIFVPLLVFDYLKVRIQRATSETMMVVTGGLGVITIAIAGIFKVYHLAGASWVLLAGFAIFIVAFLPLFFFKLYRKSVENG